MSLKKWALAACAVAALGACASGRGGPTQEPIRAVLSADALLFVGFDADGDLSITREEMEAGIAREFARADANGDGQIQPIEFQNWSNVALGGGQIGPFRLDFDRNVDNTISREEFEAEIRARFNEYDSNEDGIVVRSDLVRLLGQARPPRPQQAPGPDSYARTQR